MGIAIELSEQLVSDARHGEDGLERSVAPQIELWARLGRIVESILAADGVDKRKSDPSASLLSECLQTVDSIIGKERVLAYLQSRPYPHYEQATDSPGLLIRVDADGTRTLGKFINREFQPSALWTSPPSTAGQ